MNLSTGFFRALLDSVTEHIAVIDDNGVIQYVNAAWVDFGAANGCPPTTEWPGRNYLEVCEQAARMGEKFGKRAADGIRKMIRAELALFYLEYPCHSDNIKRWFMMRVTPLQRHESRSFVISHHNITERRLAEEKMEERSRLDGLTGLTNRRYFDEFLNREWRRCGRLKLPLSLAMLDVDHFKQFNDSYGHLAGDDCLKKIAGILGSFANRPGDLPARYGGEEFALILGNTDMRAAVEIAHALLAAIRGLEIPHAGSPASPLVTASIGVATMYPQKGTEEAVLIKAADDCLYCAKKSGRNMVFADTM